PFANFKHTEFPHYYRRHEPGESEEQFSARMAEALDKLIRAEGPDTVAAFFAEPVMGAGGGILPPQTHFPQIQPVPPNSAILSAPPGSSPALPGPAKCGARSPSASVPT